MRKENLRKRSAQIGYNLGFGAKRHFATYDIAEKVPAYFGVVTFAIGIFFLKYSSTKLADLLSVITSILGFAIFYLNFYSNDKDKYVAIGKQITTLYHKVQVIYERAETASDPEITGLEAELDSIDSEFQKIAIHKQVFFSNEFAHFKLFWESKSNAEWFVKELNLTFWKDKIPAIWRVYGAALLAIALTVLIFNAEFLRGVAQCVSGKFQ